MTKAPGCNGFPYHDMVELNCGRNPHIWACVRCRRYVPSPHPSLSHEEVDALIEFILVAREHFETRRMDRPNKEKSIMQIEVKIAGNTPADVLSKLKLAVGAWSGDVAGGEEEEIEETKPAKRGRKTKAVETIEVADDVDAEEEMLADDAEEETTEEESIDFDDADDEPVEEELPEEPPVKKAKKTKLTDKDVNAACLAHAKSPKNKGGRKATLAILAKKFGVKSISDLKADQYEAVIKALAV